MTEPGGPFIEVDLRKSHPTFYRSIVALVLMHIALAFNFWFARPTFTPYGIHKALAGVVFFALGLGQLVFLHVYRDIRAVRLVIAVSASVAMVWGLVNTQQFFAGRASLQLPILYVTVAVLQLALLIEPPVNPMSEKK